jgi:hypothetical protein
VASALLDLLINSLDLLVALHVSKVCSKAVEAVSENGVHGVDFYNDEDDHPTNFVRFDHNDHYPN